MQDEGIKDAYFLSLIFTFCFYDKDVLYIMETVKGPGENEHSANPSISPWGMVIKIRGDLPRPQS